jgi:hypothetical protein
MENFPLIALTKSKHGKEVRIWVVMQEVDQTSTARVAASKKISDECRPGEIPAFFIAMRIFIVDNRRNAYIVGL